MKSIAVYLLLMLISVFKANLFAAVSDIHEGLDKIAHVLIDGYKSKRKDDKKKTVAVLPFDTAEKLTQAHVGLAMSELLTNHFVGDGTFIVVERVAVDKIMSEQHFQMTGAVDPESAVKIGKLLGADFLIMGSVAKVANRYEVNARLVGSETGEVASTTYEDFPSDVFEETVEASVRARDRELVRRESEFRKKKLRWFGTLDYWRSNRGKTDVQYGVTDFMQIYYACQNQTACNNGNSVGYTFDNTESYKGIGGRVGLLHLIEDTMLGAIPSTKLSRIIKLFSSSTQARSPLNPPSKFPRF